MLEEVENINHGTAESDAGDSFDSKDWEDIKPEAPSVSRSPLLALLA
jgi:hypothetical protein